MPNLEERVRKLEQSNISDDDELVEFAGFVGTKAQFDEILKNLIGRSLPVNYDVGNKQDDI